LLKGSDATARTIAEGVNLMASLENASKQIVFNAMKEALQIYTSQLHRETQSERSFATFITEISRLCPKQCIPAIPFIVSFLEVEVCLYEQV